MAYALGLDIGGTKIAAALITAQGTVHHRVDLPSQTDDAEAMFQAVVSAVEEVLTRAAISWDRVVGIGAGIPGKVDRQRVSQYFKIICRGHSFHLWRVLKSVFQ